MYCNWSGGERASCNNVMERPKKLFTFVVSFPTPPILPLPHLPPLSLLTRSSIYSPRTLPISIPPTYINPHPSQSISSLFRFPPLLSSLYSISYIQHFLLIPFSFFLSFFLIFSDDHNWHPPTQPSIQKSTHLINLFSFFFLCISLFFSVSLLLFIYLLIFFSLPYLSFSQLYSFFFHLLFDKWWLHEWSCVFVVNLEALKGQKTRFISFFLSHIQSL